MLPYVCFQFLRWVKFHCGCFRQFFFFFHFWGKKWSLVALDRWSSYTVTIVLEFAWVDLALVVLDKWSSYRGGHLNRFDCNGSNHDEKSSFKMLTLCEKCANIAFFFCLYFLVLGHFSHSVIVFLILFWLGLLNCLYCSKSHQETFESWFILWSSFLLSLLFNALYGLVWNTVFMSKLVLLAAT